MSGTVALSPAETSGSTRDRWAGESWRPVGNRVRWQTLSSHPEVVDLTLGWIRLAITALVLSGVFAVLVAMARTPLVEWIAGRSYLYTALVAHVTFSLNIWLLSFVAALWVSVAGSSRAGLAARLGRPGLTLSWTGVAVAAMVPMMGIGQPVMADYIPILEHPLFLLGLAAFFAGIALTAVGFLFATSGTPVREAVEVHALRISAAAYLLALAAIPLAALRGGIADHATLVWGAGHVLQLVNGAALVGAWWMLVPGMGQKSAGPIRASLWAFLVAMAIILLLYGSPIGWEALSPWFWIGVGFPIVTAWVVVLSAAVLRLRRREMSSRQVTPLLFSLALFAAGGLITLAGLGNDTRVTAHYHGTVGAVTMAFMGLTYQLFAALNIEVTWRKLSRLQPYLYGCGLLLLVVGLFWAGEAGTPRKLFEAIPKDPSLLAASAVLGTGALGTVVGGIAFILAVGVALLRALPAGSRAPQREPVMVAAKKVAFAIVQSVAQSTAAAPRFWAIGLLSLALVLVGVGLAFGHKDAPAPPLRLTDQWGQSASLDDLRGREIILTFLYTNCPDTCPLYLSNIARALKGDATGAGISKAEPAVVVVTVDPDRDTVARLREFSQAWLPQWIFLTGSYQEVSRVWSTYGISVEKQPTGHSSEVSDGYSVLHSAKVAIIDERGRLASELFGTWQPETLAQSLANAEQGLARPGRMDMLAALGNLLQRCGAFAAANPVLFMGLVMAVMLPGLALPAYMLHTFLGRAAQKGG